MMSDAEEMLLASVNRHRDAPDQAKAGPETSAAASMSMSKPDDSVAASGVEPLSGQETSPATPTSQASRPFHEGDHVRNARLSTSDARKADHELSSTIVALSSGTVGSGTSSGTTLLHMLIVSPSYLQMSVPKAASCHRSSTKSMRQATLAYHLEPSSLQHCHSIGPTRPSTSLSVAAAAMPISTCTAR